MDSDALERMANPPKETFQSAIVLPGGETGRNSHVRTAAVGSERGQWLQRISLAQ